MKKIIPIIIAVVVIIAIGVGIVMSQSKTAGENTNDAVTTNYTQKVAATIFPLFDITREIAGENFEVVLMLPAGTSPHTFDPQPSLLRDLQGSEAVFAIGYGLDEWAGSLARSIDAPVVTVDTDINLRETVDAHEEHHDDEKDEEHHEEDEHGHEEDKHEEEHEDHDDHKDHDDHEDHGHNHGPTDPHYWLSLENAEHIAMNISQELSRLDPENAEIYTNRANEYVEELQGLRAELLVQTELLSDKNIISLHDAWHYFAEEFGLNLVGTFEPSAGKEPTPQYIANLQREVAEYNVSTLFMEPQLAQDAIQTFARDNNLSVAIIDPIGGVEERDSYINLMRYNVMQVINALGQ